MLMVARGSGLPETRVGRRESTFWFGNFHQGGNFPCMVASHIVDYSRIACVRRMLVVFGGSAAGHLFILGIGEHTPHSGATKVHRIRPFSVRTSLGSRLRRRLTILCSTLVKIGCRLLIQFPSGTPTIKPRNPVGPAEKLATTITLSGGSAVVYSKTPNFCEARENVPSAICRNAEGFPADILVLQGKFSSTSCVHGRQTLHGENL